MAIKIVSQLWLAGFLAAAALAQPPAISPRGIVNAASKMPASLAGGKLAPGASILIPGIRFRSTGSPTLIKLQQGGWQAEVRPVSLTDSQIEAVLPSDTPMGEVGIAISNGLGTSRVEKAAITSSAPGIYTLNHEGWGPIAARSFVPKDRVTMRVNGLRDRHPRVFLAGRRMSGVLVKQAEVSFLVPKDATSACWTPLWIESESGTLSNFVTISVARAKGDECQETDGWPIHRARPGARAGIVLLSRVQGSLELQPGRPTSFAFDGGEADFFQAKDAPPTALQALPPEEACTAYTGVFAFDPSGLFSAHQSFGEFGTPLDAGTLAVHNDQRTSILPGMWAGVYSAMFGGRLPIPPGPARPLFLEPGDYQVRAEGSSQIGNLELRINVPAPFEWRNSDLTEIDRAKGVELSWGDLGPDRRMVLAALSVNTDTSAMGGLLCLPPAGASRMRIPPYALANFPETAAAGLPARLIVLISIPRKSKVEADRLDDARALFLELHAKTVSYK